MGTKRNGGRWKRRGMEADGKEEEWRWREEVYTCGLRRLKLGGRSSVACPESLITAK